MLNVIFLVIIMVSFAVAAYRQVMWDPGTGEGASPMEAMGADMIDAAGGAVTLAIGLVGVMALFLGLMKVAEAGGLLVIIGRLLRPLMVRLFPDVPADHPAMGAIILNMSANALGLGNAATPFGIRAMQELDKLNDHKGTATNAMALFLAINTSSVTLLPTGVIALRAAVGSNDPAGIVPTTLFATICSTTVAIIMCKTLQRFWKKPAATADALSSPITETVHGDPAPDGAGDSHLSIDSGSDSGSDSGVDSGVDSGFDSGDAYPAWVSALALASIFALIPLTVAYGRQIAPWIIPGLVVVLLGFGAIKRVKIYEVLVEGAREGFDVAFRIIPYLVAILVAVGMFRSSGAMDMLIGPLGRITGAFGLPADALPMALLRPLSGSGAYGILASTIQNPDIGPDSYTGYLVSTIQGSTETTFYVLAVYFGAVQVRRVRHALAAALTADVAGIAGAVIICTILYAAA